MDLPPSGDRKEFGACFSTQYWGLQEKRFLRHGEEREFVLVLRGCLRFEVILERAFTDHKGQIFTGF